MSETMQRNGNAMTAPRESGGVNITYVPFGGKTPIRLTPNIVRNFVANKTKQGHHPNEADLVKFMALCQARLLNPFEGDAFLVGYDTKDGPKFSLITAHQAFLKRAEASEHYDGMESGVIARDEAGAIVDLVGDFLPDGYTLLGGWARVHRKDRKFPKIERLKLATFHKGFGQWQVDPCGMIVKCAEAAALRGSFPNTLGGLYAEGEIQSSTPVEIVDDAQPPKRLAERIRGTSKPTPKEEPEMSTEPTQVPADDSKELPASIEEQERAAVLRSIESLCSQKGKALRHVAPKGLNSLSLEEAVDLERELAELPDVE